MVKLAVVLLLCLLFLQPVISWSQGSPDPKLLEGAKKEGELVWYTTTSLEASKAFVDRFQRKYPFIKPVLFRTDVGPLLNRILFESRVEKFAWDVVGGGGELFLPLMGKRLFLPYRSPEANMIDDDLVDKEGYWTAYSVSIYVLGFNTGLVKKEDAPKSYDALLESRWKGKKVSIDTWAGVLHALMRVWGKERAVSYFTRLHRQDPVLKGGNTLRVQLLAAGEFPLATGLAHTIQGMNRRGAPVDWVALEPAVARVIAAMLGAKAPHPNAGKLFIDFLLSKEGQEMLRGFQRVPVRKDVAPDPARLFRGYQRVVMHPESFKNLDETLKLYEEIFSLR